METRSTLINDEVKIEAGITGCRFRKVDRFGVAVRSKDTKNSNGSLEIAHFNPDHLVSIPIPSSYACRSLFNA